uniref:Uncharacterized protein n=1 Tax=Ananas comosus var. bracteatus TaxID=296719 RepID=A0A6V7QA72_ANACO|nr:unnamed protein product [Ananas comosus var. bracteatus]
MVQYGKGNCYLAAVRRSPGARRFTLAVSADRACSAVARLAAIPPLRLRLWPVRDCPRTWPTASTASADAAAELARTGAPRYATGSSFSLFAVAPLYPRASSIPQWSTPCAKIQTRIEASSVLTEKNTLETSRNNRFGTSGHVAGFISEAIQGVGGIVELAPGYLPAVYKSIRKAGGLCIADEVQSGFARPEATSGSLNIFTVFARALEMESPSEPSSRLRNRERADSTQLFQYVRRNPVCTAAGLAVLRVLEREKLQENAFVVGNYLKNRLKHLQEKHSNNNRLKGFNCYAEQILRTKLSQLTLLFGLFCSHRRREREGIDARSRASHRPRAENASEDRNPACHGTNERNGVLVGKGGYYGNVFRITPPLCFTKEDSDFFVDVMDTALAKL